MPVDNADCFVKQESELCGFWKQKPFLFHGYAKRKLNNIAFSAAGRRVKQSLSH